MSVTTLHLDDDQRQQIAELLRLAHDSLREFARRHRNSVAAQSAEQQAAAAHEFAELFESAEAAALQIPDESIEEASA